MKREWLCKLQGTNYYVSPYCGYTSNPLEASKFSSETAAVKAGESVLRAMRYFDGQNIKALGVKK